MSSQLVTCVCVLCAFGGQLHNSAYDTKKALGELVKRINPKSYERRWSEEDVVSSYVMTSFVFSVLYYRYRAVCCIRLELFFFFVI